MISKTAIPTGLTAAEVNQRRQEFGYNEVLASKPNPLWVLLSKFWAPVPWMLELTIVLTLSLHHDLDAIIIAALLVFNALISFFQEDRAQSALVLLQARLKVEARVMREGQWTVVPARELLPEDVVHIRMGDIVPADLTIFEGSVLVDESSLTGEAVSAQKGSEDALFSGSVVQRGEASGTVTAIGTHTFFGKTTQLVNSAKTQSHLQSMILTIVRDLGVLDGILVVALVAFALAVHVSWAAVLPFALIVLVASIPVALPATFTLAEAVGAEELVYHGVLVTRLSAVEEAASLDVLLSDKTGTITQNRLSVKQVIPLADVDGDTILSRAAWASDEATRDPIDLAIIRAAPSGRPDRVIEFVPFEPATKRTAATVSYQGQSLEIIKGAPPTLAALCHVSVETVNAKTETLARAGCRVIAVAQGSPGGPYTLLGLIGLEDPPHPDSQKLISALAHLGVRTKMVTGDTVNTAQAVAQQVGIGERVYSASHLKDESGEHLNEYDVFAGVYPEDKYELVKRFQASGHIIGMTGDGVNDAPALKQAEVGIAVSTATDVAKAAASIVLTEPGLVNIVDCVETSRRIYQRMRTYTINKIVKTIQVAMFLTVAFFLTQHFVTTPRLIVFLLFANDFVTMSIATDHVTADRAPSHWNVTRLITLSAVLGGVMLAEAFAVLYWGRDVLHLGWPQETTMIFLMLVFSGQATVYVVREFRHFWASRPSRTLLLATVGDILVVTALVRLGWLMVPISWAAVISTAAAAIIFMLILDGVKYVAVRHGAIA